MPVPKQKQGRIRTHTRRSANMKISAAAQSACPRCGAVKLPHHVCPSCGFFKDRESIPLPSNGILWMRCRSKWNHNGRLIESAIFV